VGAAFFGIDCNLPEDRSMLCAVLDRRRAAQTMKNPLESLPNTVLMGVILTVIMVAVLAAIG
jgi:hypothetical protein